MPNQFNIATRYPGVGGANPFTQDVVGFDRPLATTWGNALAASQWDAGKQQNATDYAVRSQLRQQFGDPPPGVDPDQWFKQKQAGSQYTPVVTSKFPGMGYEGDTTNLLTTTRNTPLPNYSDTLKQFTDAQGQIGGAFNRYKAGLDIGGYAAGQNALVSGLQPMAAGTNAALGGIGGRYDAATGQYTTGLNDLTQRDYGQQANYDAAQNDVYNRIAAGNNRAFSKFQIGTNSNAGLSSGAVGNLISANSDAAVRLNLAKQQRMDEAISRDQQRQGLGYGAQQANLGFQTGITQDIYGRNYNAQYQQPMAVQDKVQSLKLAVNQQGLEAAIKQAATMRDGAIMLQQITGLPIEDLQRRIAAYSGIANFHNQTSYTAVQGPRTYLNSPQGQSYPGPVPSRYDSPQNGAPPGFENGIGPNQRALMAREAQQQNAQAGAPGSPFPTLARNPISDPNNYSRYGNSIPFDPNRQSGGWGYSNGQYIGQDANEWNQPWPVGT